MTSERYQRIGQLFDKARELVAEQRAVWLEEACGADAGLRAEVEKLLAKQVEAEEFLSRPAVQVVPALLAQNQPPAAVGQQLGHYRILSLLGAGGMGEVYLAEDARLRRKIALKVLPAALAQDQERMRRFEQEAFAASALNHPNILTIYEFGAVATAAGQTHFLASEFIDGETLRDRLERHPLTLDEVLNIAAQTTQALAAAHAARIIHRDIKPENVMLRHDGIIKVLDFGLAKLNENKPEELDTEGETRVRIRTLPGTVMGTVAYMSPEQARGLTVDARTDCFSLGVLLYEMLTSRQPFTGQTINHVIVAILEKEPPPLAPDVPAELQRIVSKALRKSPDERYPTASEMLADLKELQRDLDFTAEERRRFVRVGGSDQLTAKLAPRPAQVESSAAQLAPGAELDIAHVLFCDLVGYSLLPIDRQQQMISQLQEIVRQTEDYRRADARGQLVRLPAGDGIALAFLQDPVAPVRCAFAIARALQAYPEMRLRIGIHSGPVFLSTDINGTRNVVGSGINLAQRVMDSGEAGHILVSRNVAEVLAQVSYWQPSLHDLGEREVKHGVRIHLYNVYTDEIGNAAQPTKLPAAYSGFQKSPASKELSHPEEPQTQILRAATTAKENRQSTIQNLKSVAVLPFADMSAGGDNEYFCDGLAEELLNALAKITELKVAARTSAFAFKGKQKNVGEIGNLLNVNTILEGSVRRSGNRLRINVQLVNVADGFHLWSERYDREMQDIFDLQDEITLTVIDALKLKLLGDEKAAVLKRYTDDAEVHELFLKGRYYAYKYTAEGWQRAIEFFEKAIEKQPSYAPAHAAMATARGCLWFFGILPAEQTIPQCKTANSKALEIDSNLADAYLSLAMITFFYEWKWEKAEREFKQSIALNPHNAEALSYYSLFLAFEERFDEAITNGKRALEIDPLAPLINMNVGWTYFSSGLSREAFDQADKIIEIEPDFYGAYWLKGAIHLSEGEYEAAVEELKRAVALGGHQIVLADLGSAYSLAGQADEAAAVLDRLLEMRRREYVPAICLARIYSRIGENNKALEWLETAFEERNGEMVFLKGEIAGAAAGDSLNSLDSDPRLIELLRKMKLP